MGEGKIADLFGVPYPQVTDVEFQVARDLFASESARNTSFALTVLP